MDSTIETTPPDGTVEEIDGRAVIRFDRRFAHPVDRVWDAIARPEQISKWWCGVNEVKLELVEGGEFVMDMRGGPPELVEAIRTSFPEEPEPLVTNWTVLRVEPPHVFEHARTRDPDEVVRWELEPDGDGCRLVVTHAVTSRTRAVESGYLPGWHLCLELLRELLDRRPVDWRDEWSGPRMAEIQGRYAATEG